MPRMSATLEALTARLDWIRAAPADGGRLELIVRRPAVDARELLDEGLLDTRAGLHGDRWGAGRGAADGAGGADNQVTIMNARATAVVAASEERGRWALAGDQLYVDLDIGETNLPAGTRLSVGGAVLEVTALPHTGCGKFSRRFGVDAAKFVNSAEGRALRLRGLNARVVQGGAIATGDAVHKLP